MGWRKKEIYIKALKSALASTNRKEMSRSSNGYHENKKSFVLPQIATDTDAGTNDLKLRHGSLSKLGAAVSYGVVSTSITIFNKQVLFFPLPDAVHYS